tara:strand:+ start:92 stop:352 length:261 start_codon:yes stop_codon:yes gene_type:complete
MVRQRKTFDVERLKQVINRRNENSTCDASIRDGWNSILETILFESGNYHGYKYLHEESVPVGEIAGIDLDDDGNTIFPDPSRRKYF